MNFSVYNHLPIGQIYFGTTQKVPAYSQFRTERDNLSVNRELDRLLNKQTLEGMVKANPVVVSILKSQNLKPVINVENFKNTTYKHSQDTRNIALGIYNYLPVELKAEANPTYIQKGALLHDIGKVLIPEKILNKQSKLSPDEEEIMHLHSKLGEALLASQNIEPEVLNIVKYHHQNKQRTGYPEIKNTLNGYDLNTEIVSLADKYSALTEKRAYKTPMDKTQALEILKEDVNTNPRLYAALEGYINNITKSEILNKQAA